MSKKQTKQGQKQVQQFQEKQAGDIQVQEQQYMVFQDLDNVAGIFAETLAVLEYFKDEPDHPYVTIAQNRLILQTNLSNGIMCDLYLNNQDENHQQQFEQSKKQAKGYFEQIKSELLQKGKKGENEILKNNEKVKECVDHYEKKNLNSNNVIQQIQPLPNKVESQFNQKSVQKLIDGMFEVDNKVQSIKNGNGYQIPTKDQILEKAKQRHDIALKKLKENFPGQKQQLNEDEEPPQKKKAQFSQEMEQEQQPKQQSQRQTQQIPDTKQPRNVQNQQQKKDSSKSLVVKTQQNPSSNLKQNQGSISKKKGKK